MLLTYGQTAPGVPFSFSFSSDTLSAGWTKNLVNMCFNQNWICLELIELPHPFDVHVGSLSNTLWREKLKIKQRDNFQESEQNNTQI